MTNKCYFFLLLIFPIDHHDKEVFIKVNGDVFINEKSQFESLLSEIFKSSHNFSYYNKREMAMGRKAK